VPQPIRISQLFIPNSELSHSPIRRIRKERPGHLNPRGRRPSPSLSAGNLMQLGANWSRLRTDSNSNRKQWPGTTTSTPLNGQNGLSRNDCRMTGEWPALRNEKRYRPS
jgi:hypothetical protein